MALPFYRGLRKQFSADHITLLSKVMAEEIGEKYWDEFLPFNEIQRSKNLQSRFDLGITLPASVSSALLFYRMKIPVRVGFSDLLSSIFFDRLDTLERGFIQNSQKRKL